MLLAVAMLPDVRWLVSLVCVLAGSRQGGTRVTLHVVDRNGSRGAVRETRHEQGARPSLAPAESFRRLDQHAYLEFFKNIHINISREISRAEYLQEATAKLLRRSLIER